MALSMKDCVVGTIIDHAQDFTEDGRICNRSVYRRGIIVGVDKTSGGVAGVSVKFSVESEPEKLDIALLHKVLSSSTKVAVEAYRRIVGAPKNIGATIVAKKGLFRPKLQDALALTPVGEKGPVKPSDEEETIAGMALEDTGA